MSSLVSSPFATPDKPTAPLLSKEALARGLAHHKAGRLREAISAYDEAFATAPDQASPLVNKGVALRTLGQAEEALACYWRALALAPGQMETWHNAGNALMDLGRDREARSALENALRKGPLIADIWVALGRVLLRQDHGAAAAACFHRASALAPASRDARLHLARMLETYDPAAAFAQYKILRQLAPAEAQAYSGLGQTMVSLGRFDEAEPCLRRSIELDPSHLYGHLGLARLLLLRGDLASGWDEYEWRRKAPRARYPKLDSPEWDGSDLTGKTILVCAEQGFGDTLQFIRLLPLLAERGAKVVVLCQKSLLTLIERMPGVTSAQAVIRPLPTHDVWCCLLSLPRFLGIARPEDIPTAIPYLSAPEKQHLPAPLGTRLRVGLVWAGSATHGHDKARSVGLEAMMPILGVPGVAFYSLQVGPRAGDVARLAHPALIAESPAPPKDFADTAAVIEGLDLVIAVDTSTAHLAGALGKSVWVLTPHQPDWRWLTDREDTPWYPTMRLFRRTAGEEDWEPVVGRIAKALSALAKSRPLPPAEEAEIVVSAVFPKAGELVPRYRMTAPRPFLRDPGIRFLVHRERSGIGYEYATRSFLDAHLKQNGVFIDVGAHWGIMSLHAATRWPTGVDVLAFEPLPHNLPFLRRWIDDNGLAELIRVVPAAASDKAGRGKLRLESTMGHSLVRSEKGAIPVVTVDETFANHPVLFGRPVIVKIDVEGSEPEVVSGMKQLLTSGQVEAVIWERGIEYDKPVGQKRLNALRGHFAGLGFTAWRFTNEDDGGVLVPFAEDGSHGNIIELAPGISPLGAYGLTRPSAPPQPADPALDAALKARELSARILALHKSVKSKEALPLYAEAVALDGTLSDLFNNLGVTLRAMDRRAAAEACYRRGAALAPNDSGLLSNLGNVVREHGRHDEAIAWHRRALIQRPGKSDILFNAGIVHRDKGEPDKALRLLDRALVLDPDNKSLKWDRALALLQSGDYEAGFPAYEARWDYIKASRRPLPMERWEGGPLSGRSIFLTDEQGFGDVIQFARFIPGLKRLGAGKIILECQPELMRLMMTAPGVDAVIPRGRAVPACDFHAPLLSLPGLLGITLETLPSACPYLAAPNTDRLLAADGRRRLGLVWAGKTKPRDRSIPLDALLPVLGNPGFALFSLQVGPRAADLKKTGADAFITDLAPFLHDFAETAAILKQLDRVITIDSAVAHLAGALGIPTYLLLLRTSDWRWFDNGALSPWYPNITVLRQRILGRWDEPLKALELMLDVEGRHARG